MNETELERFRQRFEVACAAAEGRYDHEALNAAFQVMKQSPVFACDQKVRKGLFGRPVLHYDVGRRDLWDEIRAELTEGMLGALFLLYDEETDREFACAVLEEFLETGYLL